MPNGGSDKERLTALEVTVKDIESDLTALRVQLTKELHEIKSNHLRHLEVGLTRVQWLLIVFMLLYLFGVEAVQMVKSLFL